MADHLMRRQKSLLGWHAAEIFIYCCNCSSPHCPCGCMVWFFLGKSLNVHIKIQTACTHLQSLAGRPALLEDAAVPKKTHSTKLSLARGFVPWGVSLSQCAGLAVPGFVSPACPSLERAAMLRPSAVCGTATPLTRTGAHSHQNHPKSLRYCQKTLCMPSD